MRLKRIIYKEVFQKTLERLKKYYVSLLKKQEMY